MRYFMRITLIVTYNQRITLIQTRGMSGMELQHCIHYRTDMWMSLYTIYTDTHIRYRDTRHCE